MILGFLRLIQPYISDILCYSHLYRAGLSAQKSQGLLSDMDVSSRKNTLLISLFAIVVCGWLSISSFVAAPAFAVYADDALSSATTAGGSLLTGADAPDIGSQAAKTTEASTAKKASEQKEVSSRKVVYRVDLKGSGFQKSVESGEVAGAIASSTDVNRIAVKLIGANGKGGVKYRVSQNNIGWSPWAKNNKPAGSKKGHVEAIEIRLTGALAKLRDVSYRVYLQDVGWQPWASNGGIAGYVGVDARIEAIQVKLRKKQQGPLTLNEGSYVLTSSKNQRFELRAKGSKLKRSGFDVSNDAGKFYLRAEKGGVTIQSVSTGKFLTAKGAKVVLKKWKGDSSQVWLASRDGGLKFTNKATGDVLGLSGKKVLLTEEGTGFSLTRVDLVNEGTYSFENASKKCLLTVENGSYHEGASLRVNEARGAGSQVFTVRKAKKGYVKIASVMTWLTVEVSDGSKANGAAVLQNLGSSAAAQEWRVSIARNGGLYFVNRASGKALTASGKGADGNRVRSKTYKEKSTQQWRLSPASYKHVTGDFYLDRELSYIVEKNGSLWSCFWYVVNYSYLYGNKYGSKTLGDDTTRAMVWEMLRNGGGNCYRFASLFSWLARYLGYDTAVIAGYVPAAGGGGAPHGWVEVYLDGETYICDPDLAHEMGGSYWFMATYRNPPTSYWR